MSKSKKYGIKHFSDENIMSWFDFAKHILTENNLNNKTILVKGNNNVTLARRPKYSVIN